VPVEQRPVPKKRGPVGAGTDEELVGHIRTILAEGPFTGEGYRKVWARLRHRGIRTASERVRRLMREHCLQAPRRGGNPHGPKAHDGTITTDEPDVTWGTDMTTTVTTGQGTVHVFIAVDHCTCECVGLHVAKRGDRFEALEPLRQGVRDHFGAFGAQVASGLTIRHDHGSAYMSDDFQRELTFLGMASSPSFVREPEGNGCAERFIRTLKEQLLWVRVFATVEELAEALREFKRTYNERWLIGRHGHRTPSQVRRDLVGGGQAAA
jgi:transposase InsO family protein